jgi:hypothetical protein
MAAGPGAVTCPREDARSLSRPERRERGRALMTTGHSPFAFLFMRHLHVSDRQQLVSSITFWEVIHPSASSAGSDSLTTSEGRRMSSQPPPSRPAANSTALRRRALFCLPCLRTLLFVVSYIHTSLFQHSDPIFQRSRLLLSAS